MAFMYMVDYNLDHRQKILKYNILSILFTSLSVSGIEFEIKLRFKNLYGVIQVPHILCPSLAMDKQIEKVRVGNGSVVLIFGCMKVVNIAILRDVIVEVQRC